MVQQLYFEQEFQPFKEKAFDRELNLTYKHHMQMRPLYASQSSRCLVNEQAEKMSLKLKMQLEPEKIDSETG